MRTSTRIGIVGSSFAVAGSAALAALAPGAAASGGYNSTASAKSGSVSVGGADQSPATASATPSNSPQADSVPSSGLADELNKAVGGIPGVTSVSAGGPDLVAVEATANSDGQSTGCAAVLATNCDGSGTPIVITLGLKGLLGQLPVPVSGLKKSDTVSITIEGPQASCSAGPDGGDLQASTKPGSGQADLKDPSGKTLDTVPLASGASLEDLGSAGNGLLSGLLSSTKFNLGLSADQGQTSKSGGAASATAGDFGLTYDSASLAEVKGATATCGPNKAAGSTGSNPGSPGKPGSPGTPGSNGNPGTTGATGATGSAIPGSMSTSGESPLGGGIQTDEGRSPSSAPAWLALNGPQ